MPPLLSKEKIDAVDSADESVHDLISTEMFENIRDGSQSHPNVNQREAPYTILDLMSQRKLEWKGPLKATQNMGKGLHKVFKTFVKDISQDFPPFGESGSEVPYFIPEPRNFSEVTNFSENINTPGLKANLMEINNLINNQTCL